MCETATRRTNTPPRRWQSPRNGRASYDSSLTTNVRQFASENENRERKSERVSAERERERFNRTSFDMIYTTYICVPLIPIAYIMRCYIGPEVWQVSQDEMHHVVINMSHRPMISNHTNGSCVWRADTIPIIPTNTNMTRVNHDYRR